MKMIWRWNVSIHKWRLIGPSHAHLFIYCRWSLLCSKSRVEQWWCRPHRALPRLGNAAPRIHWCSYNSLCFKCHFGLWQLSLLFFELPLHTHVKTRDKWISNGMYGGWFHYGIRWQSTAFIVEWHCSHAKKYNQHRHYWIPVLITTHMKAMVIKIKNNNNETIHHSRFFSQKWKVIMRLQPSFWVPPLLPRQGQLFANGE